MPNFLSFFFASLLFATSSLAAWVPSSYDPYASDRTAPSHFSSHPSPAIQAPGNLTRRSETSEYSDHPYDPDLPGVAHRYHISHHYKIFFTQYYLLGGGYPVPNENYVKSHLKKRCTSTGWHYKSKKDVPKARNKLRGTPPGGWAWELRWNCPIAMDGSMWDELAVKLGFDVFPKCGYHQTECPGCGTLEQFKMADPCGYGHHDDGPIGSDPMTEVRDGNQYAQPEDHATNPDDWRDYTWPVTGDHTDGSSGN